jgi:hypothetical protein
MDFLNLNFDIIMTFLSSHFSLFLCDKHNIIISKLHYESNPFIKIHS